MKSLKISLLRQGFPKSAERAYSKPLTSLLSDAIRYKSSAAKNKIMIMAGEDRSQFAKNVGLNIATRGMSDVVDVFSGDRKQVIDQVGITASELEQLNL